MGRDWCETEWFGKREERNRNVSPLSSPVTIILDSVLAGIRIVTRDKVLFCDLKSIYFNRFDMKYGKDLSV